MTWVNTYPNLEVELPSSNCKLTLKQNRELLLRDSLYIEKQKNTTKLYWISDLFFFVYFKTLKGQLNFQVYWWNFYN